MACVPAAPVRDIRPLMRFSLAPTVDIPGITLRPVELSDIPAWYGYLSMPRVLEHTSWALDSADDLRALVASYNSAELSSEIRFAIQAGSQGPLVGTIGFHTISPENRTAELAYEIHPSLWGQGIMSACCRAVVAWGMSERKYVRIQSAVLETNAPSIRVLEKCGFSREGKLRSYRMVRGKPRDFWLYATVAEDGRAEA
jgi:RimJ/RimL family protein N-acetyltransferase